MKQFIKVAIIALVLASFAISACVPRPHRPGPRAPHPHRVPLP